MQTRFNQMAPRRWNKKNGKQGLNIDEKELDFQDFVNTYPWYRRNQAIILNI